MFDRIKALAWWLFTNDMDLSQSSDRREYFESLRDLEFGISRTSELRKYAEEEFKEKTLGLKEANERVDKLLGLTLVAIGWVGTQQTIRVWSILMLLIASVVLLCGRWRVTSRIPETFTGFVGIAKQSGWDEDPQFEFDIARLYTKAAYDNGELARLTQLRLLVAVICLIIGLTAFACRI